MGMAIRKRKLFGVLDFPKEDQPVAKSLQVRGWVLASDPDEVEIRIDLDGRAMTAEIFRTPRPDVHKVYPEFEHSNPQPGYIAVLNLESVAPGKHKLVCRAHLSKKTAVLGQAQIIVTQQSAEGTALSSQTSENYAHVSEMLAPQERILLMHIPKTAGTSLNAHLERRFPEGRSAVHIENLILGKTSRQVSGLENKFFLSAHLKIDTLRKFVDTRKYFKITVLRNPIRQTLSHLAWVKKLGDPKNQSEFERLPDYLKKIVERINSLDFVEFVDTMTPAEHNLFDNCQTRYLLPFHGEVDLVEAHLHRAIVNLSSFDLIGLTEQYEQTLLLLAFFMGWEPPQKVEMLNVSEKKYFIDLDDADEQVRARIQRLTRFDQLLYRQGLTVFERQLRNMLSILRVELPAWAQAIAGDPAGLNTSQLIHALTLRAGIHRRPSDEK